MNLSLFMLFSRISFSFWLSWIIPLVVVCYPSSLLTPWPHVHRTRYWLFLNIWFKNFAFVRWATYRWDQYKSWLYQEVKVYYLFHLEHPSLDQRLNSRIPFMSVTGLMEQKSVKNWLIWYLRLMKCSLLINILGIVFLNEKCLFLCLLVCFFMCRCIRFYRKIWSIQNSV